MQTAAEIEAETKRQFPIGCRVRLNAEERRRSNKGQREGTVRAYALGGQAREGVEARSVLVILWDGNKCLSPRHRSFLERVDL